MKKLKLIQFIFFIFFVDSVLIAQAKVDTISIPEITILDNYSNIYDINNRLLDSAGMANQAAMSAASLLNRFSSIFSKTNGPGLYNSFSLRGSNSSQTVVKWNDFDISNSMLGIADLSLLQVYSRSNIQITENDNSFGAIGGTINIKENISPSENYLSASLFYSTMENLALETELNFHKNRSSHNFSAGIQNNSNRFSYYSGNDIKTITNSDSKRYNFSYTSSFVKATSAFRIFTSWNYSDRKIPPSRYENSSVANQNDENIKLGIHYLKTLKALFIKLRTGLFYDRLDYNNPKIGEFSNSRIITSETGLDIRYNSDKALNPSLSFVDRMYSINSSVYKVNLENLIYLRGGIEKNIGRLSTEFKINSGFFRSEILPLSPFLQLSLAIDKKNSFVLKTGKNFRLPSFNDRFWNTTEINPIRPETSHFIDFRHNFNYKSRFNSGISVYYKDVKDNIMWLPENGIWKAINIDNSRSYGLDMEASVRIMIKKIQIDLVQIYKYNKTIVDDEDHGIENYSAIYFPEHIILLQQRVTGKRFYFRLSERYTGEVYSSFDNSETLNPWMTIDIDLSYDYQLKNFLVKSYFSIENILNADYEAVKNYPLPGRLISLGMKFQYSEYIKP